MRVEWDRDSDRIYETGVDRVVLYPRISGRYSDGVAWNGVTSINERPSGAESNSIFADNLKYLNLKSIEDFGATLEAYAYPNEFSKCIGSNQIMPGVFVHQQKNRSFGLCYRTLIGNDEKDTDYGYKIHIIYGCEATPSEKSNSTVNDSPEPITYSWEITSTPTKAVGNFKAASHLVIDSTKLNSYTLARIENALYGDNNTSARLLTLAEVLSFLTSINILFEDVTLLFEGNTGESIKFIENNAIYIDRVKYVKRLENNILTLEVN